MRASGLQRPAFAVRPLYGGLSSTAAVSFSQRRHYSNDTAETAPLAEEPATYFDYLDRFWNTKWFGTVDGSVLNGPAHADGSAADSFTNAFLAVQDSLGVEAWAVILLFGGLTRLFTLFFSFYGERASARMQLALPELKAPQEAFNNVYYNDMSSALDVQLSATALKSDRRRVFTKYDTSNLKCIAPFASSPVIIYGLYQVSRLCENPVLDAGTSSFFWCNALTLPDPLFILPVVFCGLTLLNFELSISKEIKRGWMSNIIWGARLGCLCVVPVAATFRSGVCLYFIGMSLAGLLQPLLLRVPAFRSALGFPAASALDEAQKKLKDADELQARMTVQFPYLSHILSPEADEVNAQLFKAATPGFTSAAARPGSSRCAAGSLKSREAPPERRHFPAGKNPLMQETPHNKRKQEGGGGATGAPAADERAPKAKSVSGKGSSFASSGWKSTHVAFSEEDFIPSSFEGQQKGGPKP